MPIPSTPEQAHAYSLGAKLARETFKPEPTDAECDEIEARERELFANVGWSLEGWVTQGFEQAWDRLAQAHERRANRAL